MSCLQKLLRPYQWYSKVRRVHERRFDLRVINELTGLKPSLSCILWDEYKNEYTHTKSHSF